MTRPRHRRTTSRLLTRVVLAGLCVGTGALAVGTVLPRLELAATPRTPTPTGSMTTIPTSATGTSNPGSTTATTVPPTTVPPTSVPASSGGAGGRSDRPAGLIQVSGSKTICITDPPGPALKAVELATGLTYNCIETFTNSDKTWADWVDPWIASSPGAAFQSWVAADPTGHQLIDTQNLIPANVFADPNWTVTCAAGGYNGYATQFARKMVAAGFGYSVIRLGHEMNGTWETDSLGNTPTQWRSWAGCFAQEVTAMRAVPGAHFLFDWSINEGYRNIPLADFYPGDSYVDIISICLYDQSGYPLPSIGSPDRWQALTSEPMGLNEVYAFAAQHHKPFAIPEWGTVSSQGDDATFVTNTANFISSHVVAYQSWFDGGEFGTNRLSSAAPLSLAAYARAMSKGR
jgi:hypothetical protein